MCNAGVPARSRRLRQQRMQPQFDTGFVPRARLRWRIRECGHAGNNNIYSISITCVGPRREGSVWLKNIDTAAGRPSVQSRIRIYFHVCKRASARINAWRASLVVDVHVSSRGGGIAVEAVPRGKMRACDGSHRSRMTCAELRTSPTAGPANATHCMRQRGHDGGNASPSLCGFASAWR